MLKHVQLRRVEGWSLRELVLILALSVAGAAQAAERRFTVASFDKVRIEGPYAVEIVTGKGSSALAMGDRRGLDRVSVEVQGTTLIVKPDRSGWGGWPEESAGGPVSIRLATPALAAVTINGAGKVGINRMAGPRVDLILSGAGEVAIGGIETDRLTLTLQGAGRAAIAGKAADARIVALGAGEVSAPSLVIADADVTASGSGNVALAATRSARVRASGSGNVTITGKAACMVSNQGSGQVSCGGK